MEGCRGLIQPTECRHGCCCLPGPAVDCDDLLQLKPSLQAYLDRFRLLFPRRLQYFAANSAWSDRPFLERHWQAVGAVLGTREGVLLVDTTNMPKQGGELGGRGPAVLRSAGSGGQLPDWGVLGPTLPGVGPSWSTGGCS